jgi:WD40 repeat protein
VGEDILFRAGDGEVASLSFSPDATKLASAAGDSTDVFDLATSSSMLEELTPRAAEVAFSPTGDRLLSASRGGIVLFDPAGGAPPLPLGELANDPEIDSSANTFSADGRLVLAPSGVVGGHVALYDTVSGEWRGTFALDAAVLSHDGTRVAGFATGRLSIYDATTLAGDTLGSLGLGETDGRIVSVQLNATGTHLITGDHDNVIRVRDVATWKVLLEMHGHGAAIRQVRVSADDRYVLSAGDDGGARLWDLQTGELLRYFPGHDSRTVTAIAISRDGSLVAIGSADGTVLVTPTALDQLEAEACDSLKRDLTADERSAYGIASTDSMCP